LVLTKLFYFSLTRREDAPVDNKERHVKYSKQCIAVSNHLASPL